MRSNEVSSRPRTRSALVGALLLGVLFAIIGVGSDEPPQAQAASFRLAPSPIMSPTSFLNQAQSLLENPGGSNWCDDTGELLDAATGLYQYCQNSSNPLCPEIVSAYESLFDLWWDEC